MQSRPLYEGRIIIDTQRKHLETHVLASGSKGNAALVTYGRTAILVDAGISARRITAGLAELGLVPGDLAGIFITHEHTDHTAGLLQLTKRLDVPVYTRSNTYRAICIRQNLRSNQLIPLTRRTLDVGELSVEHFDISHDAVDPVGFSFYADAQKVTFLTDTGIIDDAMLGHMDESTMLILEANHDPFMLQNGIYPPMLKKRVAGPQGHLSNESAARALLMMKRPPELQVILAHRSEHNNTIGKVEITVSGILEEAGLHIGADIRVSHGQPKECVTLRAAQQH